MPDDTAVWACELLYKWQLDPLLVEKLIAIKPEVEKATGRRLRVISGYRTCEQQLELKRAGRPAATCEESTHVTCPATGVDIQLGFAPTRAQKAAMGTIAVLAGLRWGGGGRVDSGGIPVDWNHLDLGRRSH